LKHRKGRLLDTHTPTGISRLVSFISLDSVGNLPQNAGQQICCHLLRLKELTKAHGMSSTRQLKQLIQSTGAEFAGKHICGEIIIVWSIPVTRGQDGEGYHRSKVRCSDYFKFSN